MWIAWFAGLFEGEGWVNTVPRKGSKKVYPMAALASTDEDVVRRIPGIIGIGYIAGPYQPKRPGSKRYWVWRISGWKNVRHLHAAIGHLLCQRRASRFASVLAQDPIHDMPADCASPSKYAYLKHMKLGERACAACLRANALFASECRARKLIRLREKSVAA